jgi:hypothetical protein
MKARWFMQLRCIAFLPPAALVTGLLFLLASSIVSGLEATLAPPEQVTSFEIVRYETECEMLERRIEEVARDVHACEALPGCLRSENICPASMQEEIAREYERLRLAVRERCAGVPTYVTRAGAVCSGSVVDCSKGRCVGSIVDEDGITASPAPGVFLF